MKLVYTHQNFTQVALMRSLLDQERIPSITRNEHLSPLAGQLPLTEVMPQLWVADEDFHLAQSVVSDSQNAPATDFQAWNCPRCGAHNEANMGACWRCDWEIDGPGEWDALAE